MFDPANWHWIVGGDESRAWSTQSNDWVANYPRDRMTRIASAEELADVLSSYDLPGPGIDRVKDYFRSKIDKSAEAARLRYITLGAGKDMEYREVSREATSDLSGLREGEYPLLQASVNAGEAADIAAAAALVDAREKITMAAFAIIRERAIAAKRATAAATTVEQVQAAAQVDWP